MNRIRNTKRWIKDHREQIVVGSIATSVVALYVAAAVAAVKQDQAAAEHNKKVRDWTIRENAQGRSVFQLADGSLMSVSSSDLLS
jgi:hypothetical protein